MQFIIYKFTVLSYALNSTPDGTVPASNIILYVVNLFSTVKTVTIH